MGNKSLSFTDFKKRALHDPKIKKEYDRLQPEFALIEAVIQARKDQSLTQSVLADKIGTKQSVVSRLETGRANPSVAFLKKLAQELHTRLEIRFIPIPS